MMGKTPHGDLIPTAAQVHLALSVLSNPGASEAQKRHAALAVNVAAGTDGWDGSTATCPAFWQARSLLALTTDSAVVYEQGLTLCQRKGLRHEPESTSQGLEHEEEAETILGEEPEESFGEPDAE